MEKQNEEVDYLEILDANSGSSSHIINFYKGKSIFVTGATGFVGMTLVEKLLFTCRDIRNIYLLVKPKGKKNVEERFKEYLNFEVFERLRSTNPSVLNKLIAVPGNLVDKNLGISDADLKTIAKEVAVVFHVAASVDFKLRIDEAVYINTKPTEELCQLCRSFTQLQVLVYVSTAYSNSNRRIVLEEVDREPFPEHILNYLLNDIDETNTLKPYLADERPNMYTYSKTLSEIAVKKYTKYFPTVIVRPSVAIRDPYPGWMHGWSGVNAVIAAMGVGLLRCWAGVPDSVADLIPVDTVVNLLIAAPWDSHRDKNHEIKNKVFNCCTGLRNPITVERFMGTCRSYAKTHFKKRYLVPSLILTENNYLGAFLWFLFCTLPAYIMDGFNWITGKKSGLVKIMSKLKNVQDLISYFSTKDFVFVDYNMKRLHEEMCGLDQQIFDIDVGGIVWDSYLKDYIIQLDKFTNK